MATNGGDWQDCKMGQKLIGSANSSFPVVSLCSFYVSLLTLWFVTTYSIAFVLTSRVGRAKTRPWRPPHALSRAAQRLLLDLASVGIPCCSAVFLLLFGPSPAVLLCHRPYHRLRLTVTIPTSPTSSPEASAHAVTRLLKIGSHILISLSRRNSSR
ncbi:hypothetical protein PIB30_005738 [Stylosanthes scabra]|uniref:Vomeronasal type-1 receptor n=1 Tax=Stylosanthes scabra TaxID=79078 RepID=A0ABU6W3L5_9FABA|nr:hypothetical protein [Stylosanthes scabra]